MNYFCKLIKKKELFIRKVRLKYFMKFLHHLQIMIKILYKGIFNNQQTTKVMFISLEIANISRNILTVNYKYNLEIII